MKKYIVAILFLAIISKVSAQTITRAWFNPVDSVYGFYTVTEPASGQPKAALVLFDGFGGNAEKFLKETTIDEEAYKNELLLICVPTGRRLYADDAIQELLNIILRHAIDKYSLPKDKFALGGFSSGGTIAVRYAELAKENPAKFPIQPRAVFTGDSPLDLATLYRSSEKELQNGFDGWWLGESRMIIDSLTAKAGKPGVNKENWKKINPFDVADPAPGNEQFLKDIAFRTYHDVDIDWQLQNRRRSVYQTNMAPASELVSRLLLRGHKEAEFIQSKIQGMRSDGQRHPHSWNIIDAKELMRWLREKLQY